MLNVVTKWMKLLLLTVFIFPLTLAQTKTTVEKIVSNSSTYENTEVEVEGLVTQYVVGKGATNYYLLKGDYGGILKVNTAEPAPETNKKYKVIGIVYLDRATREPFISEKSKTLSEAPVVTPPPKEEQVPEEIPPKEDNTLLYIIIAVVAVLVIILLISLIRKKTPKIEPAATVEKPAAGAKEAAPQFSTDSDFKTIKIVKSSPKTLKFIPGKLVITDGADKGKEFRIAGYPTPEGSIVSIGRKTVEGDRAYSHIHLKEKTVSREQAMMIYKDGKLMIKNLSETNFTQVNGEELKPGEVAELKPGTTIRTGEVEFKYSV